MKNALTRTLILAVSVSATGCLGPRPEVREVSYRRKDERDSVYEIDVTVENKGRGEGQAALKARLVDVKTGQSYQGEAKLDLKGRETTSKRIEIAAPASGEYRAEAEAEYPPM